MLEAYDAMGIDSSSRLTHLTAEMIGGPTTRSTRAYPVLNCSAAEARNLAACLPYLCNHPEMNSGSERDGHRSICAHALSSVYAIVKRKTPMLEEDLSTQLLEDTARFLVHYAWLTKHSHYDLERTNYFWSLKHHMMWHSAFWGKFQNPTLTWCNDFEGFVGTCIKAARSVTAGTPMWRIGAMLAQNFLLSLHLTMTRGPA